MRFLITGAGGPAGIALINQLTAQGHEVHGADMQDVNNPLLSSFSRVPAAANPEMPAAIRGIIEHYAIEVFIPTVSDELPTIARLADDFHPATVIIGAAEAVEIAHDKYLTMQRLHGAGVAVPKFALPSEFNSADDVFDRFGAPFIIKPRVARGSRGFRTISNNNEIDWPALDDTTIIQEFAPGAEYAPMVFSSRGTGGRQIAIVEKGHHTLRIASELVPDVVAVADATATAMGLVGPIDIDVRRSANGTPVVLEVNARFGANSEQAPEILGGVLQEVQP